MLPVPNQPLPENLQVTVESVLQPLDNLHGTLQMCDLQHHLHICQHVLIEKYANLLFVAAIHGCASIHEYRTVT
jgi:hypothetical protein